jgi:hypothetical protein
MRYPSIRSARGMGANDGMQMWRDAAQAQITDPVIAACIFSRPSNYLESKAASNLGLLAHLALKKSREVRAGGLPQHFIIAVTQDHVIALGRKMKAGRNLLGEPGEEAARWDRSTLRASWTRGNLGYTYDVTLEAGGQSVECSVGLCAESEEFLRLLNEPTTA